MNKVSSMTSDNQKGLPLPLGSMPDDFKVDSYAECAEAINVSVPTLRRIIKQGAGPAIVRLSPRRNGVMRGHRRLWLAARTR